MWAQLLRVTPSTGNTAARNVRAKILLLLSTGNIADRRVRAQMLLLLSTGNIADAVLGPRCCCC
jgi:hypothetical protein